MAVKDTDVRAEKRGATSGRSGRNSQEQRKGVLKATAKREDSIHETNQLMEAVVERENMFAALRRVESNAGSAGIDQIPVDELRAYLGEHWLAIKVELLEGRYKPQPVRGVKIPKPGGTGMRQLGIPTVVDRLIQQAVHQVLQPIFDPEFSESSYGFRPIRSAQDAVRQARRHVAEGRRWVVDIDLEKFFDRVNHDVLMARVTRKVKDKRVLKLIRRYLQAGMMEGGLVSPRTEGTPQGGPLSPLLSNILLDDLDKELEKRGHRFCRYADDCNIYVQSKRSAERVMLSISRYLQEQLKLKVNREKSAVDRPWVRKFLGYSMTREKQPRLKVAAESVQRLRAKLKESFREGRGRNVERFTKELRPVLVGWANYFSLAQVKGSFEESDGWIRRRLRGIIWRQWKRPKTRERNLKKQGLDEFHAWKSANNGRGPWWNAGASHMNAAFPKKYFEKLGLVSLLAQVKRIQLTT
ncbi:MAG: group II intron reverse transcriptase/maturase [Chloroflexi bacterium]|nr:MAG: group II intron reverse transcriptase/maturase [Chloroflexota bacterium]